MKNIQTQEEIIKYNTGFYNNPTEENKYILSIYNSDIKWIKVKSELEFLESINKKLSKNEIIKMIEKNIKILKEE